MCNAQQQQQLIPLFHENFYLICLDEYTMLMRQCLFELWQLMAGALKITSQHSTEASMSSFPEKHECYSLSHLVLAPIQKECIYNLNPDRLLDELVMLLR